MQDILVLGAGKIGALISGLLSESGDYRVQLADAKAGVAANVVNAHNNKNVIAFDLDASNQDALTAPCPRAQARCGRFRASVLLQCCCSSGCQE